MTMDQINTITPNNLTAEEITDQGERVTHLYPNDCYYAHLSIYYFSLQYCQNGLVLDAGSGAGYGSAYLADHGARFVHAVDISEKAVAFSQYSFPRPNLKYQAMDLQEITGFEPRSFDLIFSSNTAEHIPDMRKFLRSAWELLKADGTMLLVVPPIAQDSDWNDNIANVYHLNIWTPHQWQHVLQMYFREIKSYWMGFNKPGVILDFFNTPEQTVITEKDFFFKPADLDEFYRNPSLSVMFMVRDPVSKNQLPVKGKPLTFVDDSFTRSLTEEPKIFSRSAIEQKYNTVNLFRIIKFILQDDGFAGVVRKGINFLRYKIGQESEN